MLTSDPDQAAQIINNFISSVTQVFNNGISIDENLAGQTNDITLYISDQQNPYPFSFRWNRGPLVPRACFIVRCRCTDNTLKVLASPFPDWDFVNGAVVVKGIVGNFTVNNSYLFRFITLA